MNLSPNSSTSETTTAPIVQAQAINKQVPVAAGQLQVLDNINLDIFPGESLAIVGRSGSGKSTLLGLLAGLDSPSSGDILLHNKSISSLSEDERAAIRNQHIGFVFQSFQLLPSLTALENAMLPLELINDRQAEEKAQHWLTMVGLEERLHHYPNQLSGGEQQRVAIARAFITQPDILFADEPTGNLDSSTGSDIIELLFELNLKQNTTLVLVTHDPQLAERCQRQIQLEAGHIV